MDDKHPEAIVVSLGGKDRRIKLGPAAFRLAAIKHGATVTTANLSNPSLDTLAHLLWIGLLPDDPSIKEEDAIIWLAESEDEGAVIAKVADALERMSDGLSKAFGGDSGNPRKPRQRKK